MIRFLAVILMASTFALSAQARDDGGFGSGFTNTAPSALSDTSPAAALAQKTPAESDPSAQDLQNIMPAAGEEAPATTENAPSVAQTPCGDAVIVPPAAPAE